MIKAELVNHTRFEPAPKVIHIPPHGFVQYLDHMGSDAAIVEAARTSTGRGFVSWDPYWRCEKCESIVYEPLEGVRFCPRGCGEGFMKKFPRGDLGILEYLYKNRHETPSEMAVIKTLWKAPILTFRQLHRHRAASYNEMSGRYTQLPNDFYVPRPEEVKTQSKTNKQGSDGELPRATVDDFLGAMTAEQQVAYDRYERAIRSGIAPETARMNLPVSIYSVCVVQMNLRMDLHMLGLRDDDHAQGITRQYAQAQAAFTKALFPRYYELYEEHTKHAVTLSRSEVEEVKALLRGEKRLPREDAMMNQLLSEGFLGKFK